MILFKDKYTNYNSKIDKREEDFMKIIRNIINLLLFFIYFIK